MLRELGCDRGQGFHYARPMSADEVARLLARSDEAASHRA